MFPLIASPIIMYLEPEHSLALSRIRILGRRPVLHPEGRVLAPHGSTYGLTRADGFSTPVLADSMVEAGTNGMGSEIGKDSRRASLNVRMENGPAGGAGSGSEVDGEREREGGRERERRRLSMAGVGSKSGSGIRSGTRRARELPLAVQAEGRTRTRRTTE